jgi:Ca2+-binding RTX toxin-like protein
MWSTLSTTPRDNVVELSGTGTGIDVVRSSVSYVLPANVEKLILFEQPAGSTAGNSGTGNGGANVIYGNNLANALKGLGGNDTLIGYNGNDNLQGGVGNDVLYGGFGNDTLKGDAAATDRGKDWFVFNTVPNASSNKDKILDFNPTDDQLYFWASAFPGIATGVREDAFHKGVRAADPEDRVIYDRTTGNLYYDPDGTGPNGQTLVVTISNGTAHPLLSLTDFVIFT